MASFETIDSETIYLRHWKQPIIEIIVSGIPTGVTRKTDTQNMLIHWRVHAVVPSPDAGASTTSNKLQPQSAVFDSARAHPGTCKITVDIYSKNFRISQDSKAHPCFPLTEGVNFTPRDFLALIREKGLDKYEYNGEGSGCLYWCGEVVRYLEEGGIIGQGSRAQLMKEAERLRSDPQWWVPEDQGQFYKA